MEKNTCKVVPKQQPSKAGWALEPEHSPSGWAPAPGACLGVWAECSHPYVLCVPRAPSPKASPAQAPPPYSSSERLSRIKQSTSWNAELQYFLKRCNFIYCPWSEEERKNLTQTNQFDLSVHSVHDICVSIHRNPPPQHLRHQLKTPLLYQDLNALNGSCSVLFPVNTTRHFQQGTCTVEFSGSGQIISDSCSEMQDLVTCSTIKLPWASSSPFLIFVQTPPLLHRQQPIFRVLPLHRERATGISNICSNKDSSLISTVSAYFKHQRFQQTNTSISFF